MIEDLLNTQLAYTSLSENKYIWLFWERNGVVTAFFILAVATFWRKSCGSEIIILPIAGVLFLIHIVSSEDLQIIRGVLYFMPIYYATAVIGASKVRYPFEMLWYVVISSMFLLATVTNVPRNYFWSPRVTSEINYIEYAGLYDSVINNCRGNLIVEAAPSSPFIAEFYGVNVDYVLSAAGNNLENRQYTIDANTGNLITVWGAVTVITDINDLKSLDGNICLIVRSPSKKHYLPSAAEDMLLGAIKSWHFQNINLYLLDHKILAGNQ
jgi:hypothetical protein